MTTSPDLAARIATGDLDAFDEFTQLTTDYLLRHARRAAGADDATAQDLLQQTLAAIWEQRSRLPGTHARLLGYASGILLNLVRRHHRGEKLRRIHESASAELRDVAARRANPTGQSPAEQVAAAEVWDVAMQLPEAQREVVVLRFGQGLTLDEVAAELGIPVGTVSTRQREGLSQLRQKFATASAVVPAPLIALAASLFASPDWDAAAATAGTGQPAAPVATRSVAWKPAMAVAGVLLLLALVAVPLALVVMGGGFSGTPPVHPAGGTTVAADLDAANDATPDDAATHMQTATNQPANGNAAVETNAPDANADPAADNAATHVPAAELEAGFVAVRVFDAKTEQPLPGIDVFVRAISGTVRKTNDDGEARIGPFDPGTPLTISIWSRETEYQEIPAIPLPDKLLELVVQVAMKPIGAVGGIARKLDGGVFADTRVRLWREGDGSVAAYSVKTDAEGRYRFPRVTGGRYRMTVGGYISPDARTDWFEVNDGADINRDPLQQVLSGRIVNDDGTPAGGASIKLCPYDASEFTTDLDPSQGGVGGTVFRRAVGMLDEDGNNPKVVDYVFAKTDADGRYSFEYVPFADRRLMVVTSQGLGGTRTHCWPIGLAGEGPQQCDRTLPPPPEALAPGMLAGTVDDIRLGRPIGGARVEIEREGGPDEPLQRVLITADADGRFRFPELTPGRWILRASADGHSLKATATADVISGEWVNASISMVPARSVTIQIVGEGRRAGSIPGYRATLTVVDNPRRPQRHQSWLWSKPMVATDLPVGSTIRIEVQLDGTSDWQSISREVVIDATTETIEVVCPKR